MTGDRVGVVPVGVPDGIRLDVKPVAALSDAERAALKALSAAVYPPEALAASPGRHVTWAPADWSLIVSTRDGEVISHVGLVVRAGRVDGSPVTIGGIGGVKTHPRVEGRGYASAALRRAATILGDEHRVAFSLLVCQEHLLPFYRRLGWTTFDGRLLVDQPSGQTLFTVNRPMVLSGRSASPAGGTIDLQGPPW